jgi:hypothetical protein
MNKFSVTKFFILSSVIMAGILLTSKIHNVEANPCSDITAGGTGGAGGFGGQAGPAGNGGDGGNRGNTEFGGAGGSVGGAGDGGFGGAGTGSVIVNCNLDHVVINER